MEDHHFSWENSLEITMFNSFLSMFTRPGTVFSMKPCNFDLFSELFHGVGENEDALELTGGGTGDFCPTMMCDDVGCYMIFFLRNISRTEEV